MSFRLPRLGSNLNLNRNLFLGNLQNIKYGVVSVDTLCNDLLNWETMYLSGRLHKPVSIKNVVELVRTVQL